MSKIEMPADSKWIMLHGYIKELFLFTRIKAVVALLLLVLLGLTEGIGLLMLIPFLQLAGITDAGGPVAGLVSLIYDLFKAAGLKLTLVTALCTYVGIITLDAVTKRCQAILNARIEHGFTRWLRNRLYRAITRAEWLFITRKKASDLTHILTTALQQVGSGTHYFLLLISTGAIIAVHATLAAMLSVPMTVLALSCAGILMLLLRSHTRKSHQAGKDLHLTMQGLYSAVTEHLGGIKVAKSYGAERRHEENFFSLSNGIEKEFVRFARILAETRMFYNIGAVIALSILCYGALRLVRIPLANLLLMVFLFARLLPKFSLLQQSYQNIVNMLPAFTSALELQNQCIEAEEPALPVSAGTIRLAHGLEICGICFSYEKDLNADALHEINLTIPAGSTTALAGPSGAGKSTLADLIMGLIRPDAGTILVDGSPLVPDRLNAWRQSVGYIAQESFLFHDTIRSNLLWARPDAGEEDLWWALGLAEAKGFVARLPHGLDTVIGDRGVRLSGGERQRIALALALLRKPSLLILDEATSSLDAENEMLIQEAIEHLEGQLTIVIIAHRLSTIRRADQIVVLDRGRVVETGNWNDLNARPDGRFRAMAQADN